MLAEALVIFCCVLLFFLSFSAALLSSSTCCSVYTVHTFSHTQGRCAEVELYFLILFDLSWSRVHVHTETALRIHSYRLAHTAKCSLEFSTLFNASMLKFSLSLHIRCLSHFFFVFLSSFRVYIFFRCALCASIEVGYNDSTHRVKWKKKRKKDGTHRKKDTKHRERENEKNIANYELRMSTTARNQFSFDGVFMHLKCSLWYDFLCVLLNGNCTCNSTANTEKWEREIERDAARAKSLNLL